MKQTKEQLVIELAKIRQSHEEWVSGDLQRRKEFARAFNWRKEKKQYGYSNDQMELYEPTWMEIFVKLGKLLSIKDFSNFQDTIFQLERTVEELQKELLESSNQ